MSRNIRNARPANQWAPMSDQHRNHTAVAKNSLYLHMLNMANVYRADNVWFKLRATVYSVSGLKCI